MNRLLCNQLLYLLALTTCVLTLNRSALAFDLESPDGKLSAEILVTEDGDVTDLLTYSVSWQGRSIVTPSHLGLDVVGAAHTTGIQTERTQTKTNNDTWTPVYGERSTIRDHYNELTLDLKTRGDSPLNVSVTFRAYNEGLAFRYKIAGQTDRDQITIKRELSEFRFPSDHKTWVAYNAQGQYKEARLSTVGSGCERPMTIQADQDLFIAIGEAGLVDYARMKFSPLKTADATKPSSTSNASTAGLVSDLDGMVRMDLPSSTPWRFVMVANRPGELIENNFLLLNLNEPCAIANTSWIKPGTVLREMSLTTQGGIAAVDFAVEHNMQYVHFDAGWYGNEYDDASDATTITVDPKRSAGPLALHDIIAYARERGIGVIVYVNRRALERQLDDILPLYKSWGIAGVKYGFVKVGSQRWTSWLHDAIRKAADHELMVDVHDEYRPTGYERTYPNLMTTEGIQGDETSPSNVDTLTLLFSRSVCGPADNTICYFASRVDQNATHAYQLAKAVCIYSPWQYLYWYDLPKPADKTEVPYETIGNEPELEFFDAVPTAWDETRVIEGEIGRYVVIARRKNDHWFIGAMNSGSERTIALPLDFLSADQPYTAHRYLDDPTVDTRTKVRIIKSPVNHSSEIELTLSAQGGEAIRIVPDAR